VILFDEKIVAVWFLALDNKRDWMAAVREIEPDAKYELVYRFRYYVDDKTFDSEDKKNWYKGEITGTRNYVLLSMRSVAEMLKAGTSDGPLYEVVNDKGLADFLRRFQDMPFAFVRREGKGKTE
jgi:hypothetical protein